MNLLRVAVLTLDGGTRDLLDKEIGERVSASALDPDTDEAILAHIGAHALSRYLPGEVLHALQTFTHTGRHALVLRNLPAGDYPPTPVTGFGQETPLAETNAVQLGLIQLLGITPFAVDYENGGRLIRNVVPNPSAAGTTSSWGADSEFFWHTDNPHLPFGEPGSDPRLSMPRYLTFYGIRNEEAVPTEIAAVEDALPLVDDATRRVLRSPAYDIGAPASNDAEAVYGNTVILDQGPDGTLVRFDRGTTRARDAVAASALQAWIGALARVPRRELVLGAGDFLIFDNYRVLHRRSRFTPAPAATARWLRRCYAS
ncbi:TauD/TfdA family dioxygenase [Solwaraspora sp. WMMD406]|uniref:TauD/TfdA family dioxygenase n=1 Tax=Solwaraspora sp. WMMD406 TaxID=3016095 RepID=UPI002416B112|nr:TauD/TfdA family dioxygenase [Solwaraspora sp. WMMD406]MDG4767454.1 TauD/TfdA family dioxygenase [Solwaraspora sp. WMMD406]